MPSRIPVVTWLLLASAAGLGCADPDSLPCVEREGAADGLSRVPLWVRSVEISAEVADDEDARTTAWAGRRCDLDALLWVPDQAGPAGVTLCEVTVAVDLAFIRGGQVVAIERDRAPCSVSCEACPVHDGDEPMIDAVLWLLAGRIEIDVGDEIDGLAEVELPAAGSDSSGG